MMDYTKLLEAIQSEKHWAGILGRVGTATHHPFGECGPDIHWQLGDTEVLVEVIRSGGSWKGEYPFPSLWLPQRRFGRKGGPELPVVILLSSQGLTRCVLTPLPPWPDKPDELAGELGVVVPKESLVNTTAKLFDHEALLGCIYRYKEMRNGG